MKAKQPFLARNVAAALRVNIKIFPQHYRNLYNVLSEAVRMHGGRHVRNALAENGWLDAMRASEKIPEGLKEAIEPDPSAPIEQDVPIHVPVTLSERLAGFKLSGRRLAGGAFIAVSAALVGYGGCEAYKDLTRNEIRPKGGHGPRQENKMEETYDKFRRKRDREVQRLLDLPARDR